MTEEKFISLNEKIRILSRIMIDIIERNNIRQTTKINLTGNHLLILKILNTSGVKKIVEISKNLNISNPATSKNIDYLVKRGLISRKEISTDRRSMKISLLAKGKSIINNYNSISEEKIKSILTHFNEKENEQLNLLLDKYIYLSLSQENNLSLFCLQCGGEYEGKCFISEHREGCYFQLYETAKNINNRSK